MLLFSLLLGRGVATWLESGREKRNLGMAGIAAVLQVGTAEVSIDNPEFQYYRIGSWRKGPRVGT